MEDGRWSQWAGWRGVERGNTMTCSAHPSPCQTIDLSCAGIQHVKTLFALKDGDIFLKMNASLVFRSLHLHLHICFLIFCNPLCICIYVSMVARQ